MKNMLLVTDVDEMLLYAPQMKKKIQGYPEAFLFLVDGEPTMIGELELTPEDVYIKMVESLDKGNGNGRDFIHYLKSLPDVSEIWGESVIPSIEFWRKMGAEFNKSCYQRYEDALKTGEELEEDFLIPFTIYC